MTKEGDSSSVPEVSQVNRRRILKTVGASAATAAFGIGSASAKETADEMPWEYEDITGTEKQTLLQKLQKTPEYSELLDVVETHGGTVRESPGHATAARLTANGKTRSVVSIDVKTEDDTEAYVNIGRDKGDGVAVANVGYSTYTDDGILEEKEIYDVMATADQAAADSPVSIQSTDGSTVKKKVEPEAEIRRAIENAKAGRSHGGVNTLGVGDGPCDECQWAAVLICQNGCGLGGGLACGILGITGIGGVACTTLVSVVCSLAAYYSCSETGIGEAACEEVGLC